MEFRDIVPLSQYRLRLTSNLAFDKSGVQGPDVVAMSQQRVTDGI